MQFVYSELALHDDYSVWHYDCSLGFAVEVPTEKVRRLLPKGVHPFEVKPQVSLITINTMRFMEGNHNFDRPLTEVTISACVIPDLFLAGRMPKFACYVLNIGVTDTDFAKDPYNADKLPFYSEPITVQIAEDGMSVSARDAHGPIFDLKNVASVRPLARKEDFFQVFASAGDELLHGAMTMDADTFEHQVPGNAGVVHDHPIFKGLGGTLDPVSTYTQIFSGPDALGIQHYYRLRAR